MSRLIIPFFVALLIAGATLCLTRPAAADAVADACASAQAPIAIAAASEAVRTQAILRLVDAKVPAERAIQIVESECAIDDDALVKVVLNEEPRPKTLLDAIRQATILTLRACPLLAAGPIS
jgi:hypothetical protein